MSKFELDRIELHDALLRKIDVDFVTKVATVSIDIYGDPACRTRTPAAITFEGVHSISQVCDLNQVAKNAGAGNVNYWVPAQPGGTTFIYLVDGCIAISAQLVHFAKQ